MRARPARKVAGMGFETPVLLGNISILQIHADLADGDIFVMSGIDQSDQLVILIVYFRVGQHVEVLALHLRQLIIGNFPAVVQLRTHLGVDEQTNENAQDQSTCQKMQNGLKQPSEDSEQADKKAGKGTHKRMWCRIRFHCKIAQDTLTS